MFRTEIDILVEKDITKPIAAQPLKLNQVANLAYIAGTYDKIENILVDSLGYTATQIIWSSLININNISNFDAIFLNCTSQSNMSPLLNPSTDTTLANYVANGGSLYVSDWAIRALVGNLNSALITSPCSLVRPGGVYTR